MRAVKSGNYAILAQEHTLVLGWNSAAVPLLRQIALAKARVPKPSAFERCASPPAPPTLLSPVCLQFSGPAEMCVCVWGGGGGGHISMRANLSP